MPTQTTGLGLTVYDDTDKQVTFKDYRDKTSGKTDSNTTKIEDAIVALETDKADKTQILTDVPANAKFTDTIVTKESLGLDKVPNLPLATKSQAEIGLDNEAIMTPKRTAEAINALSSGGGSGGGTNLFNSAKYEYSYVADLDTVTFEIPPSSFDPTMDIISFYLDGARLSGGDHYTLTGNVVNLAFTLEGGETVNYLIEKKGYRYSDLVGAPDVEALESQLNEIVTVELPKKVDKLQENWITGTLSNGWTGDFKYRKNNINQVEIIMQITAGTVTPLTEIADLPSGYRPIRNTVVKLVSTSGNSTKHGLYVFDGGVIYISKDATFTVGETYIGNVIFSAN